ncbi:MULTISPECIES: hypothetical protein [unclassified Rhizobium]|uniref:hypothetical protein n=1 Tax=unclassified Rhizobium TaxID=2613769 RepID=UPI0024785756|nr:MULTISPECIES: hypothetical protein [unclassified Rhizobium]MDH7801308.1 hypothetical protein [Rhizobium sp. AN70]
MKKLVRRLMAGMAIIGFAISGWRVVPTLSIVDAFAVSLGLFAIVTHQVDVLITGEWPA